MSPPNIVEIGLDRDIVQTYYSISIEVNDAPTFHRLSKCEEFCIMLSSFDSQGMLITIL